MTGADTTDGPSVPETLRKEIRSSLDGFSQTASTSLNLAAGLAVLCHGVARAFGALSVSAWLHDRRLRELVLAATSGGGHLAEGARLSVDGPDLPAQVMRNHGVRFHRTSQGTWSVEVLSIPLRGRRRALGVLLIEGIAPSFAADPAITQEAEELGRQLSAAIENLLLLEDVLRSRRELTHTFDSLEDLVAVCDRFLRLVHVNRTFCDRVRQPRERLVDRPLAAILGAEAARWVTSLPVDQPSVSTFALELPDEVLGGRFTMTLTPLGGNESPLNGVVFVARDITTQARLEAEREALRERLAQSEKLAALGQFVAGVAHELNNPLQAVLGHLELLRREKKVPSAISRDLGTVFREAERAARIVEHLLLFAGRRRVPQRPVNIAVLAARVAALRSKACKAAGIEIVRHVDTDLPPVTGHRLMLQQALLNVVLNAEQAIGSGGGTITLAASCDVERHRLVLTVRDSGPGISEEALPRVFEPFFTTKDVGKGTGLGLALTYGIITDHGGTVRAGNHPEGGAVFTIDLPSASRRPGRHTDERWTRPS